MLKHSESGRLSFVDGCVLGCMRRGYTKIVTREMMRPENMAQ